MVKNSTNADVIIAGGGIAGIVSAIELLNLKKQVILFERGPENEFGGLAKLSFGGVFFVDTPLQRKAGMKDSPELAYSDWCRVAHFSDEDVLPKKWAKHYVYHCTETVYKWLKGEGIKFFPAVHWVERGLFTPGNSYPRFHLIWGTGHELIRVLSENLLKHPLAKENLTIKFKHRVDDFKFENDVVCGVVGTNESNNESFVEYAASILIASGGIGGNIPRVKENWYKAWGEAPETILNGTNLYADGHLHDASTKLKANITHMDKMWPYAAGVHHPRPTIPNQGLSLVPPKSALWLNFKGERIGPMPLITAFDTRFLVEQVCKQEKKYSWQVLNLKIAHKELAISGAEFNPAIRDKKLFAFLKTLLFGNKELVADMLENCPDFIVAESLEELAQKMNQLTKSEDVDVAILKDSIKRYDDNIKRGPKYFNDDQLRRIDHARKYTGDKIRTSKFQRINDPKALPLIAIREFIVSRKTLGGIQTDLICRVLNEDGEPIKGLYAVGEASGFGGGGMHGQGALEGTFLGACIFTGRIAAHSIAGKPLIKD
jgi:predicted oxidoreductase